MAEGTDMNAIIDDWKKFRPDEFQPDAETKHFEELDGIFCELAENDEKRLKVEKDGVVIEKFNDLDKPLLYIEYRRYSNVYSKMMYNKFFVPIWRAAMNGRTGYVAYPKLAPLKDTLDDFAKKMKQNKSEQEKKKQELEEKKEELEKVDKEMTKLRDVLSKELEQLEKERRSLGKEFDDLEKELENILRLSIPPIALAIDALHTDQPNKRTMYYHRDVCIDNIYLYKEKDKEGKLVYDDARLMLTKLTRGSHEDYVDDKTSPESLYKKYHHHSSLKVKGRLYHRRHDWNSFGVYILEVLDMFYGDDQTEFRCRTSYDNYATYLKEKIEGELEQRKTDLLVYCQQYLDIAIKCLGLKENKERVVKHTMPSDMIERFKDRTDWPHFQLFFEYPVSEWTAELLWLYEDARPNTGEYETYNKMNDKCHSCGKEYDNEEKECSKCGDSYRRENGRCQACHLRDKVSIPNDVNFKCAEPDSVDDGRNKCEFDILTATSKKCHFYCLPCYTSGERLFCTEHHGITSPILGHHSRYALILYGAYEKDSDYNPFKNDANILANTLKHKLIYGVDNDHVLVKPIDGEDDLERCCQKMRKLIHGVGSTTCANDAGYTLFLYYSGHGGKRNNSKDSRGKDDWKERGYGEGSEMEEDIGGDWCPLRTPLTDGTFPVIKRSTIEAHYQRILGCTKSQGQMCKAICVEAISVTDSCFPPPKERVPATESKDVMVRRCGQVSEETESHKYHAISDITRWLSELLRSLYYKQCCKDRCEYMQCVLEKGDVHEQHKCVAQRRGTTVCEELTKYIYQEQLNDDASAVPLAYFNPRGVYLKAFPFKEGMEVVEIAFEYEMKCDVVRKAIAESDRYKNKVVKICLLTTLTKSGDYSRYELVCDDNINDRIGSYVLYYHVITEPVQVTLIGKKGDDSLPETETLELWLDKLDLNQMVYSSNVEHKEPTQLPNFFVFIAYALRYRSSANSGQAQNDADTDVRKSFKQKLVGNDRWEDWDSIENAAKEYWNNDDVERFAVERLPDDTISVKWDMSSLPAPGVYGERDYPQSIVEGNDKLDEKFDDEHVNYCVDSTTGIFSSASVDSTPVGVSTPVGDTPHVGVSTPVRYSTSDNVFVLHETDVKPVVPDQGKNGTQKLEGEQPTNRSMTQVDVLQEKAQKAANESEYSTLIQKNRALRTRLAEAEAEIAELKAKWDAKTEDSIASCSPINSTTEGQAGANAYADTDTDSSDSELEPTSDDEYVTIPPELLQMLTELCHEHSIEDGLILQSPHKWQSVAVLGIDAQRKLIGPLKDFTVKNPQFSDYTLTPYDHKTGSERAQLGNWQRSLSFNRITETEGNAVCELIVQTSNPAKVFVVGPAHLLFCKEANEKFQSVKCDIARIRDAITKSSPRRTVTMRSGHSLTVDIEPNPLIAYRYDYEHSPPADKPFKLYRNDCVMYPFDSNKANDVYRDLRDARNAASCPETKLRKMSSPSQLQIDHSIRRDVVVQNYKGKLYHQFNVEESIRCKQGLNLTFALTSTDKDGTLHKLTNGDSGSIVYCVGNDKKGRRRHIPWGMLVESSQFPPFELYHAIVLSQAFKDIQDDYHMGEIKLFSPNSQ